MRAVEEGDLVRRMTDGAICEVVEVPEDANYVIANVPRLGGGMYRAVSVKDYEPLEECSCCAGTGLVEQKGEQR